MIQFKAFVPFIPVILSYSQVSPIQNTHTDTHTHTHTHTETHTHDTDVFLLGHTTWLYLRSLTKD